MLCSVVVTQIYYLSQYFYYMLQMQHYKILSLHQHSDTIFDQKNNRLASLKKYVNK